MIKFIISVWISGILQTGDFTEDKYLVVMYDPHFESRADCEMYALQAQDRWFKKLSKDALTVTDWVGVVMNSDPECLPYNVETKEIYDGPDI